MTARWGITFPLEGVPLSDHRDILLEAEALGYTDAWTFEVNGTDAFVPIAAAASWTERIRFGTAIANVFTRTPMLLAMSAAGVGGGARGRFCLGVGASSPAIVERWNGVALERPLGRIRDTVTLLRQLLAGEKVSMKTGSFEVQGARLAHPPMPPPPIYVAALRERMLALAGSLADGVIINWLSPDDVPKVVAVAKDAARAAGKDPDALDVVCRIFVIPTPDANVARMMGRLIVSAYLTTPFYYAFHEWLGRGPALRPMMEAWTAGDRRGALPLVPEQVIEDVLVYGDRQQCLDKIEAYCKNGVTAPVINVIPTSQDPKQQAAQSLAAVRELAPR